MYTHADADLQQQSSNVQGDAEVALAAQRVMQEMRAAPPDIR